MIKYVDGCTVVYTDDVIKKNWWTEQGLENPIPIEQIYVMLCICT